MKRIKVYGTGTRGIPDIQGGVETHCRELYPRLQALGCDVTVARRKGYFADNSPHTYRGVALRDIAVPRIKGLEAFLHTFLAILDARRHNADVVHIHAIGPGIFVPLARLLGMRTVVTNHGADYRRPKWGPVARAILRLGERWSTRMSHAVIAISPGIATELRERYDRKEISVIANGVGVPAQVEDFGLIREMGLEPDGYILALGRLSREKGFHDLIEAYRRLEVPGMKLVIAGSAIPPTPYSRQLHDLAHRAGVMMAGEVHGEKLRQLMGGAALFALPSYHEGLSISLLEAMAAGRRIALSDIPANRLPGLHRDSFFPPGNPDAMARVMKATLTLPSPRTYDLTPYDWDEIARHTLKIYRKVLRR